MNYMYYIVKETRKITAETKYITYGIEVVCKGSVIKKIPDISHDFSAVTEFADLCNRLRLDPMQLQEAAEDMLDVYPKFK